MNNRLYQLTPPGLAAIGVIRLAGPAVDDFLLRHFTKPVPMGRCVHGTLRDGERVIDDPVVVRSGTDVIDINLHGGPWVMRSAVLLALSNGFSEIASSLPLAEDAVDGSSIIWREVLQYLPLAKTEQATRMLLAQPAAWDVMDRSIADGTIAAGDIQHILGNRSGHWLLFTPTVAIIGPTNVGKSTLANQLFAQERSITADLPGTTRDWVGEIANLNGLAVMLVDTPGARTTEDPIEQAAIRASGEKITAADLVLLVLDQSHPLSNIEHKMIAAHPTAIAIANKSDKPPAWDSAGLNAIHTSAMNGDGMDKLRRSICSRFSCDPIDLNQPRCWTPRQTDKLRSHEIKSTTDNRPRTTDN